MKNTQKAQLRTANPLWTIRVGVLLLIIVLAGHSSFAYERYKNDAEDPGSNCSLCHGDFKDDTSTKGSVFPKDSKHEMHQAFITGCNLCHTSGDSHNPYLGSSDGTSNNDGLGCNGCHNAKGLRAHHVANGVPQCASCHVHTNDVSIATVPENVKPPYYGTADTLADNPLNAAAVANTNENWTIGDFIGTDNDGDNLYDMADYDGGHPFIIATSEVVGNDVQISWFSAGGRCEVLQQVDNLGTNFVDIGSVVTNSGMGVVTNNETIVGGATSPSNRFFRVRYTYPTP